MNRGLLPGLIFVALGVMFTLHNFDIVRFGELRRFWPLLLIAVGLSQILNTARRNWVLGGLLIAAGAALQLSNLGLLHVSLRGLMRFWPLIVVAFGVQVLLDRKRRGSPWGGIVMIAAGAVLQLQTLDLITFDLWRLWPVVLILLGIKMMLNARHGTPRMR